MASNINIALQMIHQGEGRKQTAWQLQLMFSSDDGERNRPDTIDGSAVLLTFTSDPLSKSNDESSPLLDVHDVL